MVSVTRKRSLQEHLYDFTIQIDADHSFQSCQVLLAEASDYFDAYVTSNQHTLSLSSTDPETCQIFIEFINKQKLPEQTDWLSLLIFADRRTSFNTVKTSYALTWVGNYHVRVLILIWTVASTLNLSDLKQETGQALQKKWKNSRPFDEETMQLLRQNVDLLLHVIDLFCS